MSSKPRRLAVIKNSTRAAHIGVAALRRQVNAAPPSTDATVPFVHPIAERSEEIAVRLRFLINRRNRGEALWGERAIADAIAECQAEMEAAQEQERHRRR
jgi:hypothetical protein